MPASVPVLVSLHRPASFVTPLLSLSPTRPSPHHTSPGVAHLTPPCLPLRLVYFFLLRDGEHALGERQFRKKHLMSIYNDKPAKPVKANLRRAGPEAASLIGAMLACDADRRPSAAEALTHPLFMTLPDKVRSMPARPPALATRRFT